MIGDDLARDVEPAAALGMLCFQVTQANRREVFEGGLDALRSDDDQE